MTDKPRKTKIPGKPAIPLHMYLSRAMDERDDLSNIEVARRLGYSKPNVIAMIRSGSMKVPISKVPALARILEVEPVALLQRVLMEYDPDLWEPLHEILGGELVTRNELALVQLLREQVRGLDPNLTSNELFVAGFKALVGQALDEHVMKELADRSSPIAKRVSGVTKVNDALEELCKKQARERDALRRKLITRASN